jgi:TRAP transporter TAXI family solute receptor
VQSARPIAHATQRACAARVDARRARLRIRPTPAGTLFFAIGSGIARTLQTQLGVRTSPRPYAGPSRCLPLLNADDVALALHSSLDAGRAFEGLTPYARANHDIRLLARVLPMMNGYFVRADSPYRSFDDIRGARMVYELRGSHAQTLLADAALATGGLTVADIQPFAAAHVVESIDALIEGRVDIAVSALGTAAAQRAHATIAGGIRALALGSLADDAFMAAHMSGSRTAIAQPSPGMVGVDEPTLVAGYDTFISGNASLSDDDAYAVTMTLVDEWTALQRDYPALRAITARELYVPSMQIPYHPGALRAYRQSGL